MRNCTIRKAKTNALISFAVAAKLICVFVFEYAKIRFSHDAAHILDLQYLKRTLLSIKIIFIWLLFQNEAAFKLSNRQHLERYVFCL